MTILTFLAELLGEGTIRIGQVLVRADFSLCHSDDAGRADLEIFSNPEDAVEIAKYDDRRVYRPLKTAPNLRHGWVMRLASLAEVRAALDLIYPAALGTLLALRQERLPVIPLRETLARQTGMYAVTKKITDSQAEAVMGRLCGPGCIRRILWPISAGQPRAETFSNAEAGYPILCAEVCNLFVAACRQEVKGS